MPRRKSVKSKKLIVEKEVLLIDQVKQQPALYNIKDEKYYNTKHKSALWDSIADLLQEQKEILQDSWDSLKAKYKRELKKVESAAARKEIYNPNWIHYNNLVFIKEANVPKSTSSNLDILFKSITQVTDSVSTNMYKDVNDAPSNLIPAKIRSSADNVGTDYGLYDKEHDEDMTFFISLLKHVKKVPEAAKLGMRNELNKIVKKFAYEDQPIQSQKSLGNCTNCCSAAHCYIQPGALRERQIDNRLPYATISQHNRYHAPYMIDYNNTFIKKEKKRQKAEIDYECDTDDSDCMFFGEAKVVKKMIKHKTPSKTQKKENLNSTATEESSVKTLPMLGINPFQTQQLYEHMILQQQHLNILKHLNPGLHSALPTHSAVSPNLSSTYTLANSAAVTSETTANSSTVDTTKNSSAEDK